MVDEMGMPIGAAARIVIKAPVESGLDQPVFSAERTIAARAVERDPGLIERVQCGCVYGAGRLDSCREIGHLAAETRVRQETGDPDGALGFRKDPVDDVLLVVDVQLPSPAHLDNRGSTRAAVVLARERDTQPCRIVHADQCRARCLAWTGEKGGGEQVRQLVRPPGRRELTAPVLAVRRWCGPCVGSVVAPTAR